MGVVDKYINEVAIRTHSIEQARQLTQAFRYMAQQAEEQSGTLTLPNSSTATLQFLQERIQTVTIGDETLTQSIEESDNFLYATVPSGRFGQRR